MKPIILYNNKLSPDISFSFNGFTNEGNTLTDLILDDRPYIYWTRKIASNTSTVSITINFSSAQSVDTLAVCGHNLSGCSVRFQAGGYSESRSLNSNNAFALRLSRVITTSSCSIQISGITNQGMVQIGSLYVGEALEFPVYPQTPYVPFQESIVANKNISKSGNLLGVDVRYNPIKINAVFPYIPTSGSTFAEDFKSFWNLEGKKMKNFFYAWDLEHFPEDVFFVRFASDMIFNTPLSMSKYIDSLNLIMEGTR